MRRTLNIVTVLAASAVVLVLLTILLWPHPLASQSPMRLFGSGPDGAAVPIGATTNGGLFCGTVSKTFTTQTAVGQTDVLDTGVAQHHSIQLVPADASTCTYRLQGSNDGSTWYDISAGDITCTAAVQSYEQDKPARYVRGNCLTFTAPTAAAYTTVLTGTHNDMVFTAVTAGTGGNSLSIAYLDPGKELATEAVTVVGGTAVIVTLRSVSAVLSTAAQVKTAVDGNTAAHALMTCANSGGDNGTGVVTAMSAQLLINGVTPAVTLYYAGR